ncbi:bleomycin resistance protein [Endozoicomonas arenosclerae]|uniref:bleomycin resistance protein n=1 Tax=Endozoicomonas arenosclerae TaxID=1633495 RepID=UPI000785C3C4|nr:VOC family protein [Endozoicomonas arenosclerae]
MVPELTVTDFEKSFDFYTRILGFRVRNQRQKPNFAYLEQEKAQIMIEEFHPEGWNTAELTYPLGRGVNFQIELTEIQPVLDRIYKGGVSLYRDLKESWYNTGTVISGQKEFLIQDPDGYMLRFTQYLGEKPEK